MNRIEYINQKLKSEHLLENDYAVISALIHALTPEDACSFLDLTFEQDSKVRRYILNKISKDISKAYISQHKILINKLLNKFKEKKFVRRESCAASLYFLYDSLPVKTKKKIIEVFLDSKSSRNRDRAFKILNTNWDKKYFEKVEQVWYLFHDSYCIGLILNHFPINFLLENYKGILQYTQPFQTSKLFIKLGMFNTKFLDELLEIDEISYCYVLTKFDKKLSDIDANKILQNNFKDERIGLLLWSFGQMGLWETLVKYDKEYKEKHYQAKLEKYTNN